MTHRVFICFCILSLCIIGCLPGTLEKAMEVEAPPTAPAKPPTIAELHLSLAKEVYAANEPIPLRMSVRAGKFDLLVPAVSVAGEGAFGGLIVTDAAGNTIKPNSPILAVGHTKNLLHDGTCARLYPWRRTEIRSRNGCDAGRFAGALQPCPGGLHAPNPHGLEGLSGVFARPIADGCRHGEGHLGDSAEPGIRLKRSSRRLAICGRKLPPFSANRRRRFMTRFIFLWTRCAARQTSSPISLSLRVE